jgi:hypothetical protein
MTTRLKRRREKTIEQLLDLAPQILLGASSETYRTCGNPNCRCHGEGPRHGPHMYINYKGENGRTTGYYVPKALQDRVRAGLDAWKTFRELTKQLAQTNKEIMDAERPKKTTRRKNA